MFTKTLAAAFVLTGSLPVAGCAELQKRPAAVTVHAVDQDGNPVPELQAYARGYWPLYGGDEGSVGSGRCELTMSIANPCLTIGIGAGGASSHKGYYGWNRVPYFYDTKHIPLVRWTPWNPNVYLVYKKIKNPVPMYVPSQGDSLYSDREGINFTWPVEIGAEIGFDFIAADWVAPHGRGTVSDVFIKIEHEDALRPKPKGNRLPAQKFFKTTLRFPG